MRVQSRSRFTTRSAVWPALAMGLALCASETALAQYADGLGLSAQQEQKLNAMLTWNHARAAAQIASSKIVKQADVTAQQVKRVERYINERAEITTSLAMANIPGWKDKFEGPVGAQTIKASERDWTKWRSVASFVAPQLQLRNVHETGTSDVGAGSVSRRFRCRGRRVMAGSGKTLPHAPNGWLAVMSIERCS